MLFTAVNYCSRSLRKQKRFAEQGQKVITCAVIGGFQSTLSVSVFLRLVVVALIMIDSSRTRNSLVGVKVQSLHVIERCSN